jgi:hypothetical protein
MSRLALKAAKARRERHEVAQERMSVPHWADTSYRRKSVSKNNMFKKRKSRGGRSPVVVGKHAEVALVSEAPEATEARQRSQTDIESGT